MPRPQQVLTDKEKNLILALYEMGKTDQQVADVVHLPRVTFKRVLSHNGLVDTRKKGVADDKVELSLYNKAMTGNVTAQIFWLCNRRPDRWKNVNRVEHSGEIGITLKDAVIRQNGRNGSQGK